MGQCTGKQRKPRPDPQLTRRTRGAPPLQPFVQVDFPVKEDTARVLPPPSLGNPPPPLPQQHSMAGAGASVKPGEPVGVKSCGTLKPVQPCTEPASSSSRGLRGRPVPPPKPVRSPQTKLSTAAAYPDHHSIDEGYGTIDRADRTTTKDRDFVPLHLVSSVSKPEPQVAYSTACADAKLYYSTMKTMKSRSSIFPELDRHHQGRGYDSMNKVHGRVHSPPAVHTAPIQRKEVPYTMPVPPPAVRSVHNPATRKEVPYAYTTRADNRYCTLERSRSHQQFQVSRSSMSPGLGGHQTYHQSLMSRGSMSTGLEGHQGQRYYGTKTRTRSMAAIPEYGDMFMARQSSQRVHRQATQLEPYFENGQVHYSLSCSSQARWQPTSNPLGRHSLAQS